MLKALNYRVVVKPVDLEETDPAFASAKAAGIEIVKSEMERNKNAVNRGIVIHVGKTAEMAEEINVGDEVIYARYAGLHVVDPYTDEAVLYLNDEDLIGLIVQEGKE